MAARKTAMRVAAALTTVLVSMLVWSGSALALSVTGADQHGAGDVLESGDVDVLNVAGKKGDGVFLAVKRGDTTIAQNLPYVLGEDNSAGEGENWTGVVTLDLGSLDAGDLDGAYIVEAYASRAGGDLLYRGALYGVYADLPDGSAKLVGMRTVGAGEEGRGFVPADTLYYGGRTYKLSGGAGGAGSLHFAYEEYDEQKTVDGSIKYVDASGAVIAAAKIPGIPYGGEQGAVIPPVITSDAGDVYRTVSFRSEVVAKNPGQTSFTIPCVKMSDADKAAANYYVATIQLVDGDGRVIAADSVDVTGDFLYTAPSTIYKSVEDAATGEARVVAYTLEGSPLVRLSAADDGVVNRSRTVTVRYTAEDVGALQTDVTFNLLDGSKRVSDEGRVLGTARATVSAADPSAMPEAQIEVDGVRYHLVGDPSDYAYEHASGKAASVDVYYTPEGYAPPGAYTVTVNYVDFVTGAVVGSQEAQSSPDDLGAISIETPERLRTDGADYVRLAGQDGSIAHSYYSGNSTYTVYYRDVRDTLSSGAAINTIRVVYEDAPGAADASASGGVRANDAATATTRAAAEAADARELRLNAGRTYNVLDGEDGNSMLTNEEGVDSNTERIEDDENPLAAGVDDEGRAPFAQNVSAWALPVGAAVLAALAILAWVVRRRKAEGVDEA